MTQVAIKLVSCQQVSGTNPSGTETRIVQENQVNTMAADALAKTAAMVMTMLDKYVLVFHEEGLQKFASFRN